MKTNKPDIIVITGAESTGKSVLTRELAKHYGVPFYSEYAREYVEKLSQHYTYSDLESIAKMQIAQMQLAAGFRAPFLFFDTWLIVTKVWMDEVFQKVPSWIEEALHQYPVRLWLHCDTDLPWEPDPLRENGGERRNYLSERYRSELNQHAFNFREVSGQGSARIKTALEAINNNIL